MINNLKTYIQGFIEKYVSLVPTEPKPDKIETTYSAICHNHLDRDESSDKENCGPIPATFVCSL